ncbi:MAG: hydrogenase nickel incorporation protein HypA/HybF [Pseudonocardiales bacterium]|jgi:hydrogenase nickel incorporation protein HypA/HybF|nr:hydrogenase nickel incorporation protein HypA/HybF [Pseudonocardiales bacterium]
MHELAIATSVVDTISARVAGRKVHGVRLEIGKLSGVSVESLRFCFDIAAAGSEVDGAALEIEEPAGRARCERCLEEFLVDDRILLCACGSSEVRVLAGDELRILSVEVSR